MLPEFLVGSYRQYKQDTKFIATWLGTTAKSFGYSSESIPPETDTTKAKSNHKTKNGKPKTKKQKRDAARRIPREQRKYIISIQEFLPLAQYIVAHIKSPSKVPSSVVSAIKRAVEARKDTSDWFKSNAAASDGHDHFLSILEQVLSILEPYSSSGQLDEEDEETLVENMFETLEIQEPSKSFLDSPGLPQKDYGPGRVLCEFIDAFMEYVQGYLEETLAASALFRDIHKIYAQAEQVWRQYKDDKVDLITAAITSNAAIDLIRRLEEDFFEQFPRFRKIDENILKHYKKYDPKHKDAQQLINFMYRAKLDGSEKCFSDEKLFDSELIPFHTELYEEARYVFLDIHGIFLTWFIGSQSMTKVVYDPQFFGCWNPEVNYDTLSPIEKYRTDRAILCELIPDMSLLATSVSGVPTLAEDELLRGSRNFINLDNKQPQMHLWMLASLRLFCDIHHILGPSINKPFEALRRLSVNAKNTITEYLNARERGDRDCWPCEMDEDIKRTILERMHQSLFVDEVKEYIDHAARNVKWWPGKKEFELLRRHPSVCGLMEFNIRACLQEAGMLSLLYTHIGITSAHLYNALKQEGACKADWADMDLFVDIHGEETIFRGPRPKNLEDYHVRYVLTQGISAKTFAQNRRDRGIIAAKSRQQCMAPPSLLVNVLKLRYINTWAYVEKSDKECDKALYLMEEVLDDQYAVVADGPSIVIQARSAAEVNRRKLKSVHKTSRYTPVELLMSLEFGLSRDIQTLYFDYHSFNKSCWTVLQGVRDMCGPMFDQMIPDEVRQDKHFFSFSVQAPVVHLFSMGVPLSKAKNYIRKSKMPKFPPTTSEYQQVFDQKAIFKDIGSFVQNKIVNGRLRHQSNVRARKIIENRPERAIFKLVEDNANEKRVTFKGHRMWTHTNPQCTKTICVCGAKGMPTMKAGWKKFILDTASGNK